jgi:F0F1-type ATP synthase membrane subunit b/b'
MTQDDRINREEHEEIRTHMNRDVAANQRDEPKEGAHRDDWSDTPLDRDPNDPEVIRRNIERTRAQMGETIDRIQYRLDPDRLRGQAEEAVRDATIGRVEDMAYQAKRKAKRAQRGIVQKVKSNPIPSALIGLGLGWLMMSSSDKEQERTRYYVYDYDYDYDYDFDYDYDDFDYEYEGYGRPYVGSRQRMAGRDYDYARTYTGPYARGDYGQRGRLQSEYDNMADSMEEARQNVREGAEYAQRRAGETADSVRRRAGEAVDQAQEQVGEIRDRAQEEAEHLRHQMNEQAEYMRRQAQRQMRRTKQTFNTAMENNPLAVGALALAAGALIGLSVPRTHIEDEWMGDTSDHLKHEIRDEAQDTLEKAKRVAKEASQAVGDAAKDVSEGASVETASKEAMNRTKAEAEKQNLTGNKS